MNEIKRLIYIISVISKLNSNVLNIENPLKKQKICDKSLKSSSSYPIILIMRNYLCETQNKNIK
jgi:hypothetical protein